MRLTTFKNIDNRNLKVVELYGLSRAGKTTLLKKLISEGNKGLLSEDLTSKEKLFFFLNHFIREPIKTTKIFYRTNTNWLILKDIQLKCYIEMFFLRNSYLAAVFAKYEKLRKSRKVTFVDEFLIQSLQIILQKKSSKKEILAVLKTLPKTGEILLLESSIKERYDRIKKTRFPGEQISREYAMVWMKNTEENYKIIKEILHKHYGPVEKNLRL